MQYIHPDLTIPTNQGFALMQRARAALEQVRAITRSAEKPLPLLRVRELDVRLAEVQQILNRFHSTPWIVKFRQFLEENDIAESSFRHWHQRGRITAPPFISIGPCRYVSVFDARAWMDSLANAHAVSRRHLRDSRHDDGDDRGGSPLPIQPTQPTQPHLGETAPPS